MPRKNEENEFASFYTINLPNHRIGNNIKFVNKTYTAKSKADEKAIRSDPLFGQKIFEK